MVITVVVVDIRNIRHFFHQLANTPQRLNDCYEGNLAFDFLYRRFTAKHVD